MATTFDLNPFARIVTSTVVGVESQITGFDLMPVIEKLLAFTRLNLQDTDLIEFNEAFAAQV